MSSLYLSHFGFNKQPFQITPDLDFFFSGGHRGDVLNALQHVATHDEGIITLVAEVGSGKTLLARLMITRLGPQVCTVYLDNPCFSRDEILAAIARDLGLTHLSDSRDGRLAALQQELLRRDALGQRVVLVIDEAHTMPIESLEEVRLLSNLETGQHKLINIMLFGQPELDDLLADSRLRQVRDRVIHRFELQALQPGEASAYVDHRLRAAGWQGAGLFSPTAMERLVKASEGRARRINLLADKALLAAYAQGATTVELAHVNSAVNELPVASTRVVSQGRGHPRPLAVQVGAVLLMTALAVLLLWWYLSSVPPPITVPAVASVQRTPQARASVPAAPVSAALVTEVVAASAPAATVASVPGKVLVTVPVSEPMASAPAPSASQSDRPASAASELAAARPILSSSDRKAEVLFEHTRARLKKKPLQGYTIQLIAIDAGSNVDAYLKAIQTQLEPTQLYAQNSSYKGKAYVAVYYGDFSSAADGAQVIVKLPMAIKVNRPMVRSWVKIQQEQLF